MRGLFMTLAFAALAGCSPPPGETQAQATTAPPPSIDRAALARADLDLGPYANSWDAAEFSRFQHILHAPSAGLREITLRAESNAPGGETVAMYPLDSAGQRIGPARILFAVATRAGAEETTTIEFPTDDAGVKVEVVVENAGGRRHQGSYAISVAP